MNYKTKKENESSIKIFINKETFEKYKGKIDLICIFQNGCRLSERNYEKKETIEERLIFSSYEKYLVPIKRTKSIEYSTTITNTLIIKTTYRKIIYQESNFRISLNKIESNDGIYYTCAGETEYDENESYENVLKFEYFLMHLMKEWLQFIVYDTLSNESIYMFFSPKIQPIIFANFKDSFYWAYKWNGIKGKLLNLNDKFILAPDLQDIQIIDFPHKIFKNFKNVCIQVELLDDYIIIVELLGAMYDKKIYSTEPNSNMKFLNELINLIGNEKIFIDVKDINQNIVRRELLIQKYYNSNENELPETINNNFYDGFIINKENISYKIKLPTFDAKYLGKNEFQVGVSTILKNVNM